MKQEGETTVEGGLLLTLAMYFMRFPPFSIIQQVLQKVVAEKVSHWPTQSWWPFLMNMLINYPIILPRG